MIQASLEKLLSDWRMLLSLWAGSGALVGAAREALQLEQEPPELSRLAERWAAADFRDLPPVVLLPSSSIPGAAGAYAASTGSIYLNADWLQGVSGSQATRVLNEELGHHLDALLNRRDTPGDEGELFALLLDGSATLSEQQRQALCRQDDHGSILLGRRPLAVEQAVIEDTLPNVSLAVTTATVQEDGPANLVYVLTRSGFATEALTVNVAISGSALLTSDYNLIGANSLNGSAGTIRFASGSATATLSVAPIADSTIENDESVILAIAAGSGYLTSSTTGLTGTIKNDDFPLLSLAVTPASVLENGAPNLLYSFTRSGPLTTSLVANFSVSGSASFNIDYSQRGAASFSASAGTISFPIGAASATITIDPTADSICEADENVILALLPGTGYSLASAAGITGTISNDDLPAITLTVAPAAVPEDGNNNLLFTFSRTGPALDRLNVNFKVAGTASSSNDYSQTGASSYSTSAGSLSFAEGSSTATLSIDPSADDSIEANETVILSLLAGSGYSIASSAAVTGTISNDDFPSISLDVTPASVLEDGPTNLIYSFRRSGPTTNALTANFSVGGSAGFGTDYSQTGASTYSASSGKVIFAIGSATASITVNPTTDTAFEGDESVVLTLTNGTGYIIATPTAATGMIINDDLPLISLSLTPASVTEDGTSNLVYTFNRTGSTSKPLTLNLNVAGSAEFGNDYSQSGAASYSSSTATLTFLAGSSSARITIDPTADSTIETNETVLISVAAGSDYSIGNNASATGTISNDDLATVNLTVSPASVLEDGSENLIYTFSRSGATSTPLSVNFRVGGTATFTSDYSQSGAATYSSSAGTLTFAAGSATASLTIDPRADSSIEADETVLLTLASASGYRVGTVNAVSGSIRNDDLPAISLAVAPASVLENGATNLVYTFSRTGPTTSPLSVNFLVGGNAIFNSDYSQSGAATFNNAAGTAMFAAGATTTKITLDPSADAISELDETVVIALAAGSGYSLSSASSATGTISNDDLPLISVAVSPAAVAEDGPDHLLVSFSRSGSTSQPLTVNFNVAGTASYLTDYSQRGAASFSAGSGSITFAAGASTVTLSLNPTEDLGFEPDESVEISLRSSSAYALASTAAVSGTILNDDAAPQLPADPPAGTISQSGLVQASIAIAGEVDSYSLDTLTGAIIRVSVSAAQDDLWPLIDLRDPQGALLESAPTYNSAAADLGFWDLATGKARIDVHTQAGRTGAYGLQVAITTREELKTEVIRLTNLERQKEGLTPLVRSSLLDQAADGHVQDMDDHDQYLAHTGSNGSTPVDRIQATGYKGAWVDLGNGTMRTISSENAAAGQPSPAEVVTAWMNSPGHRAAIMDPFTREIGVGVEYDNEAGRFYWIQNFGNPWSAGMTQWF